MAKRQALERTREHKKPMEHASISLPSKSPGLQVVLIRLRASTVFVRNLSASWCSASGLEAMNNPSDARINIPSKRQLRKKAA